MMKLFAKIQYAIQEIIASWKQSRKLNKHKRLYPDFKEENEYDCGDYKFIWGVASLDSLSSIAPCLYSMNDIDIIYSREKKRYILSVETAYWFDTQEGVMRYLQSLLEHFTKWMDEQGYDTHAPYKFWMSQPSLLIEGETIPEVYTSFKIFVAGYKSVHSPAITNTTPKIQLL